MPPQTHKPFYDGDLSQGDVYGSSLETHILPSWTYVGSMAITSAGGPPETPGGGPPVTPGGGPDIVVVLGKRKE